MLTLLCTVKETKDLREGSFSLKSWSLNDDAEWL